MTDVRTLGTTIKTQPVYGLPGARPRFSRFQAAIISYAPTLYFPCNELAGSLVVQDYLARYTLTKSGGADTGAARASPGASGGVDIVNGGGFGGSTVLAPAAAFTIGCVIDGTSVVADTGWFGNWDGNGTMLYSLSSELRLYVGGSSISQGSFPSGSHFLVGTYDGTNANLYRDGSHVAGPTNLTLTASAKGWGINWYSGAAKGGIGSVSDAFVLPVALDQSGVAALATLLSL